MQVAVQTGSAVLQGPVVRVNSCTMSNMHMQHMISLTGQAGNKVFLQLDQGRESTQTSKNARSASAQQNLKSITVFTI